jgi:hypothetical protein
MIDPVESNDETLQIAQRWCTEKGSGWSVLGTLGKGSTAPVFAIAAPDGPKALKVYDAKFSTGDRGQIEQQRIDQLLALKGHGCPFLVEIYEGERFEGRLYLLMSMAPGSCLEGRLPEIPRSKIRQILDQVARAAIFLESKNLCHRDIKAANISISDDFAQCTLLDVSVIRDVYDPIGVGTDHDGELPIVATARYSPPEYLFRLLEPGPRLWHALNIYQLGALLHDLIMRAPLFQDEYLKSSSNRYRFAWIVATVDPEMNVGDVDQDLLLVAKRALDKDWQRRSALNLEDFLAEPDARRSHALQYLGLSGEQGANPKAETIALRLQRLRALARMLEEGVVQYLRTEGVTARHEVSPGQHDYSRLLLFSWKVPTFAHGATQLRLVALRLNLQLVPRSAGCSFGMSVELAVQLDGATKAVTMDLPEVQDESGGESRLVLEVVSAFETLAQTIIREESVDRES